MNSSNQTFRSEQAFYSMYFFGQNVLWKFAGLISTYLLDIGIDAAVASVILLAPKIWDAINDTIFGYIVDRTRFKNGEKFMPWIKLGTAAIAVTTILLFAIPKSIVNPSWKIAWFVIAYILFDAAYTMLDAPMFAMPTVMTSNIAERTSLIAGNKLWSMVGAMFSTILIPLIRPKTGWFVACIIFACFGTAFMLPFLFKGKERLNTAQEEKEQSVPFRDMLKCIGCNKYLLVVLVVIFIMGVSSVETTLSLIISRNCFGSESFSTIIGACAAVPVIFVSAIIPKLAKKWDKFRILISGLAFSALMGVASYFAGYSNMVVSGLLVALKSTGVAFYTVICYMFVADTVEYGAYKNGSRAAGMSFSLQTFVAKLKNAFLNSIALGALAILGYDSSLPENAVQSASVVKGIWTVFNTLPAIGCVISIILLLLFYKLRDSDVQQMALYNNGEITREQACEKLESRFGAPAI